MSQEVLHYWWTGGPLMPVLALLCYGIWYTFLELRRRLHAFVSVPERFERDLLERLSAGPRGEVAAAYAGAPDPLSRCVSRVLLSADTGRPAGTTFDQCREGQLDRVRRDLLILTALTAAAPLVGLLGTVIGMVATFQAVAGEFGNTSVQVSAGISQALITTQCGLVVAIPGLFGAARILRLLDQADVRMGTCRTHLVFGLEQQTRAKGAA